MLLLVARCSSYKLVQRCTANIYDVAPGAAAVLLVLLLRIVSKDVYVAPNLRQALRITQLNRTYQVHFRYRCYRKKERLIRRCSFHHKGDVRFGRLSDMYESVSIFRTGETTTLCVDSRNVVAHSQIQFPLCYRYR